MWRGGSWEALRHGYSILAFLATDALVLAEAAVAEAVVVAVVEVAVSPAWVVTSTALFCERVETLVAR